MITIQGFLDLLEKDIATGNDERAQHDVERIRSGTHQLARLLDDLLTLSKVGRAMGTAQPASLSEVAREAAQRVGGRARDRGVGIAIEPELPIVLGDRQKLLAVFQNLFDNAVKFLGDQPEPRIEVGQRREGKETVCFVRDNGVGIDPRYHGQIFGLFERLSREVDGTGIGLALVKRIVELHGGRIWVESEGTGTGSTFCFTLPPIAHGGDAVAAANR